jgi:hypothetical protein
MKLAEIVRVQLEQIGNDRFILWCGEISPTFAGVGSIRLAVPF